MESNKNNIVQPTPIRVNKMTVTDIEFQGEATRKAMTCPVDVPLSYNFPAIKSTPWLHISSRTPAKDARKIPKNPLVPIIDSTNSLGTFESIPTPIIPTRTPKYIELQIS